jgi:A/G-specific adenine glycosylase
VLFRSGKGIWQNLYEFPGIESEIPLEFEDLIQHPGFRDIFPSEHIAGFQLKIKNRKHVLTHRILYASFYEIQLDEVPESLAKYRKIKQNEFEEYPIHRLMQIYLENKF